MRKIVLILLFVLASVSTVNGVVFDCQTGVGPNCIDPPEPPEEMFNFSDNDSNGASTSIVENETTNNSETYKQNRSAEKDLLNGFLERVRKFF